ncbi:MAG TPA: phosphopentomutase [Pseudidiomarina sp.]|nr:phosphopentomutase [Pseudidiomarina sp.]
MARAIILVLDSFGIGAAADAERFGDVGADTLGHIAQWCAEGRCEVGRSGSLRLPNLASLGLYHAAQGATGAVPMGCKLPNQVRGLHGWAQELSSGKDTPSGHWEMAGVPVLTDWGYFLDKEQSFPQSLLDELIEVGNLPGILGNCHASGTTIIQQLGDEHRATGKPIVYTSADSVLQIAAHEESFGLESLYDLCRVARKLVDPYNIGRVIARPFSGESATDYRRTGNRQDFAVPPPAPTMLDKLVMQGGTVISIGKIADIFAHQGITRKLKATGLAALMETTRKQMLEAPEQSIIFTNLVDFDSDYGHRRDVCGYAKALEQFDTLLPSILSTLRPDDLLILTADHGCDPTWPGTDHTREYIPVLAFGHRITAGSMGRRETFADIAQSITQWLKLEPMDYGTSFFADN